MSGAVPPPAARPLERAARVPRPVCPGCGGCGRVDPAPAPQRAPLRAGVAPCGGGGRASPGGVPSTVVRGAWCQALSLPRPPVLWSGLPGFRNLCVPGAVDAGVWTLHRPHSVRPCGTALLAVGVAGGRPRGGVPSTVVRGAWCQALSLPRPPVLWSGSGDESTSKTLQIQPLTSFPTSKVQEKNRKQNLPRKSAADPRTGDNGRRFHGDQKSGQKSGFLSIYRKI